MVSTPRTNSLRPSHYQISRTSWHARFYSSDASSFSPKIIFLLRQLSFLSVQVLLLFSLICQISAFNSSTYFITVPTPQGLGGICSKASTYALESYYPDVFRPTPQYPNIQDSQCL